MAGLDRARKQVSGIAGVRAVVRGPA